MYFILIFFIRAYENSQYHQKDKKESSTAGRAVSKYATSLNVLTNTKDSKESKITDNKNLDIKKSEVNKDKSPLPVIDYSKKDKASLKTVTFGSKEEHQIQEKSKELNEKEQQFKEMAAKRISSKDVYKVKEVLNSKK